MCEKDYRLTLCLGSNVAAGRDMIRRALLALINEGLSPISCTDVYPSSSGYLNQIVVAKIGMDYDQALAATKEVERVLGRLPEHKEQGIVPVDIDIVVWNGEVIRRQDYESEYFRQGLLMLN